MQDYNRRFNDNDACWLIKVDTRITGPFSFNEVLAKLTSGEIYSHHEVMQPLDRWRSLVAQPLFSAAVERLKRQIEHTPEQTMTRTERGGITRTLDLHSDRITPTPFANTITPPPLASGHPLENPQSAYYSRPLTKRKASLVPYIALGSIAVVIAFALLFFKKNTATEPQKQHSNFISYVDKGLVAKKKGEWAEALRNFKLAHVLDSKDIDLTFELAPLLIQYENHAAHARGLVDKVMVGQYKKENLAQGKTIVGLSYAYEGQYQTALSFYKDALEADETYLPAQINRGLALMLAGKYQEAESQLMQVLTTQADTSIAGLYLLENYVINGPKSQDAAAYDKAMQLANQLTARRIYDGQQEILLLQAYVAFKRGNSAAHGILLKALQVDPDQTDDHIHSPMIDWRGLNWKNFAHVCRELSGFVKGDTLSLLEFTCKYNLSHETESQQSVDQIMNRHLNSPLPHVAQAIVSYRLGEFEKAKDSLSLAQKFGANDKLYLQILVKTCSQLRDSGCIRQNLDRLTKVAPLHAQVAKLYERAMSADERNQVIQVGLRESRNYLPLLRLQ